MTYIELSIKANIYIVIYIVICSLQWVFLFSYNILILILHSIAIVFLKCRSDHFTLTWGFLKISQCLQNKMKPPQHGISSSLASSLAASSFHPAFQPNQAACSLLAITLQHTFEYLLMWFPLAGTPFPVSHPRFTGKNYLFFASLCVTS